MPGPGKRKGKKEKGRRVKKKKKVSLWGKCSKRTKHLLSNKKTRKSEEMPYLKGEMICKSKTGPGVEEKKSIP